MGALLRSWELTRQILAVAAENPELLIFPLLSVFVLFVLDGPFLPQLAHLSSAKPSLFGMLLVLYCASNFVIIFFNSALMAAVALQFDGKEAIVGDGLRAATRWIIEILAWSLIAGTVGLCIQVFEDRLGRRLIGRVVEAAWSMATFFIIPVIIFERRADVQALRRSADLFKGQWGTEVAGRLGLGAVFFVLAIPAGLLSLLALAVAPGLAITVAGMSLLVLYLLHEAAEGVFVVALYRYATTGAMVGSFTPNQLRAAFDRKDTGWTEVDLDQGSPPRLGTWQDLRPGCHLGGGANAEPPSGSGAS
jgi:hypothetical protein